MSTFVCLEKNLIFHQKLPIFLCWKCDMEVAMIFSLLLTDREKPQSVQIHFFSRKRNRRNVATPKFVRRPNILFCLTVWNSCDVGESSSYMPLTCLWETNERSHRKTVPAIVHPTTRSFGGPTPPSVHLTQERRYTSGHVRNPLRMFSSTWG